MSETVKLRLEYIKEALAKGRVVILGGIQVRSIDVRPSRRSVVIVVNNGEAIMYPSRFISLKLEVL